MRRALSENNNMATVGSIVEREVEKPIDREKVYILYILFNGGMNRLYVHSNNFMAHCKIP